MKGWMGLCLALTLVVVGCKAAPQSEISHDGKWVAYSNGGNGITIAQTANPANKRFYKVEEVSGFEWSNTNRYLVWGSGDINHSSNLRVNVLDTRTRQIKRLPVKLIPPFIWSKDDVTLTGFASDGPMPKKADVIGLSGKW